MKATFKGFAAPPSIPLVVIGALKAGGSGKTSVTLALAHIFSERGLKVAILTYQIGGNRASRKNQVLQEVPESGDWRMYSDEAILLKRESKCRVFVTRNRAKAWMALHSEEFCPAGPFDLILSDDGYQDPRLDGAFRILLMQRDEKPGLFDLIPAGGFRETWKSRMKADLIIEGPIPLSSRPSLNLDYPPKKYPQFWREMIFPPQINRQNSWIVLCGLGDNESFIDDLVFAGFNIVAKVVGNNHIALNFLSITKITERFPHAGLICTQKDFLKLDGEVKESFPIQVVDQAILLEEEIIEATANYILQFRLKIRNGWNFQNG